MEPGVARMDFELDSMSTEFGREVERILNEELVKGYPAEVVFLARDAALTDPELIRTKVNLIPEYVERDQGHRHRRARSPGRWWDPCALDPRGGPGPGRQDGVEGQGQQEDAD